MDDFLKQAGRISRVATASWRLAEPFEDTASRFADMPGTVLLMSGGDLDCARYHILGVKPWLTFKGRGRELTLEIDGKTAKFDADPFDTLKRILDTFKTEFSCGLLPITSGLLGYLSYDLKDCLEKLPRTSVDDLGLPHICLFAPSVFMIADKTTGDVRVCMPERDISEKSADFEEFKAILTEKPRIRKSFTGNTAGFRSNFKKPVYLDAIRRIREYIASGHVYQVNMSQRFVTDFDGDPFELYRKLYQMNPAPFFAYVNAGDHVIVSTSPERFVLRDGKRVETRPIKGTRPRGKTPAEDERFRHELVNSKKDDAELSMIVDLLRNDIGKVCEADSVRVTEHKRLEAYQNVYHLVSVVEGTLDDDKDSVDLIRAVFPGGSITGCPKIRAMEIIDELEPNRRHIYTGSIGFISFHDSMDLSIAIRTATLQNGKMVFSVGGGIVFDSDPEDEYEETLHKGKTLMNVFKGVEGKTAPESRIWLNGVMTPTDQASVSPTALGFQYGYGFFETIRTDKGVPGFLEQHMTRFGTAWKSLFETEIPDLDWDVIIRQVVAENGLEKGIAAVKILAAKGTRDLPPFDDILTVMARPYIHRLAGKSEPGLRLWTCPEARQSPLADHKTTNYLYYWLAGKNAVKHGCDEALILNPDNSVSETNSANILLISGKTVIRPQSPHFLAGIMERNVCDILKLRNYRVEHVKVMPEDVFASGRAILTNSLMGAVPVLSLDGSELSPPIRLCEKINEAIMK